MESFTHESDDSSSCTQSDGEDSTNSSNGTNPFLLCPRGDSLHSGGHGRLHDGAEDSRPYKLARLEPPGQLHYHASNRQGLTAMPYAHNAMGEICGPEGIRRSALLSRGRSHSSSMLEDCRDLPPEFSSASRLQHAALPYIGAGQNFFPYDQWLSMRQQNYFLKPVTTGNNPASTLLWPMNCKGDKMPINFGNNAGNFYMGLTDPQPGRCRRTDGKKWRCGRAVVPEQKYCERHMHRGRGRSKAAKLAKVPTAVDANQPHGLGQPLNQPLIQLLNQLNVPVQSVNQTPQGGGQQPTSAIQPLNWLQKSPQTSEYPHTNLPYLGQPLLAEQLGQFSIQPKSCDWPCNQSPMQAEPLNLGQSNGRPPVLAQAIPINAVCEVKISPDRGTGLANTEAIRMHSDDPNDVLNLDVQGIKRLLENAPCSRRSTSFINKPKQLPNVANLSNVAHIGNPNTEPKKPPSLMDVLKMVDPFTSTSSVFHNSPPNTVQVSANLPTNMCQPGWEPPKTGQSVTHLSLTWTDDQTPEKQSKQCSSPSSLDQATKQMHDGEMPLNLSKEMHEGWPNTRTSETTNGRQSEVLLQGSKKSEGALIKLEKACLDLMDEKSQSSGHSNCQKNSAGVNICNFAQAAGGSGSSRRLEARDSHRSLRNVASNYHEASPKSNSDSMILPEGSLDVCDSSGKSEGFISDMTEKIVDQHGGAESPDVSYLVLSKKRVSQHENYASLDMNLPILVVKTECQPGNSELRIASPGTTTPMEHLQTKAALDRSSSGSSCNASSLSKSTLSLDPAAVSNMEPSSHVSLAN